MKGMGQATALVQAIANAIATAEGFYSGPTAIPVRANNPGDLENSDIGNGTISGKTIYASISDGWNALYNQVELMLNGESSHYSPSMTIDQIANIWTGGDNAAEWAATVAQNLGVSTENTLQDLLGGAGGDTIGGMSPTTLAMIAIGAVLLWALI